MNKEELEKEAEEYADEHAFRVPYDGSNKFYDDVDFKASKEGYIAGAKPREKRIAELERKLEQTEKDLTDYQFNYPKIKDLEKENTELKTRVENQKSFLERIRAKFELGEIDRKEIEGYLESEQLTKAKEIIREFMKYEINEYDGSLEIHFEELKKQAEQFLNSEVEK